MHLAIHSPPLAASPAARLLGPEHPLARAIARRASLRLESAVVGVVLTAALAAVGEGAHAAVAVVVGAVVAGAVNGFRMLLLCTEIRSLVLTLLVDGCGSLPLREVQRERSRLLDARRRQREAEWLVRVADGRDLGWQTIISPRLARAARNELLAVAAALRDETPAAEGVALAEQVAREPWSPLYGQDTRALRDALARVRFLLSIPRT